jgi:hypothetical protein
MEMISIGSVDLSDAQRIDACTPHEWQAARLDKHRGVAAQRATDIRRALAEVENSARDLREWQGVLEKELLSIPAASWAGAVAKARYVLNLYAAGLAPVDTHHRDLVAAVFADFDRLSNDSWAKSWSPISRNPTAFDGRAPTRKRSPMQNLSPRQIKIEESLRLGVKSGWYSTKVSGTFVSGPHDTEADCLRKIAEIDPPPAKAAKMKPV